MEVRLWASGVFFARGWGPILGFLALLAHVGFLATGNTHVQIFRAVSDCRSSVGTSSSEGKQRVLSGPWAGCRSPRHAVGLSVPQSLVLFRGGFLMGLTATRWPVSLL